MSARMREGRLTAEAACTPSRVQQVSRPAFRAAEKDSGALSSGATAEHAAVPARRAKHASFDYFGDVIAIVSKLAGNLPSGSALTPEELAEIDSAYFRGQTAGEFAELIVIRRMRTSAGQVA